MLLSVGAWLAALGGLGAVLLWLGRPQAGRILASVSAAGFAAVAALPVDQWLLAPLENRFPQPPPALAVDGIVVLGGFLDAALSADRGQPSLNAAADRLAGFVALARDHPQARLVFTGGPMPNRPDGPPEADGVRLELARLGFAVERVVFESRSRSTWENGVLAKAMVAPKPGETWLLVTSAAHIPRAVGVFRAVGWPVVAAPVGYKSFLRPEARGGRGFGERLALIDTALHEWLGLAAYRIQGRIPAIYPSP
jgi:uncharacterized SAM-binding protein YcdF (DUF218 family)